MSNTKPLKDLIVITHPLVGYYKLKNGMEAVVTHLMIKDDITLCHGYYVPEPEFARYTSWGLDGHIFSTIGKDFDLALPLKIEVGKYYRTRDGVTACVCFIERGCLDGIINYPSGAEHETWHTNGRWYDNETEHPNDLIAEVTPDGKDMP